MHASLPMYMRPELADEHQLFWSLIRKYLADKNINADENLQHPSDFNSVWLDEKLLLSQTCGMPYRNGLHGKVQLVGTPDYQVSGCEPGYYRSTVVVRKEDAHKPLTEFSDAVLAYNSETSQSGYSAVYWHCRDAGFWFAKTVKSGGHQGSAEAVVDGRADIAAIDGVTWRLLCEYESFTDQLAVLDWTKPTPGLPYITSLSTDREQLFGAISDAIEELPVEVKARLGIHALIDIDAQKYLEVPNPEIEIT